MGQVVFTIGCPGSGKTTYAEKRVYHGWQKLCLDDFRVAIWGSKPLFWNVIQKGDQEARDASTTLRTVYHSAFDLLALSDVNLIVADCHLRHGEEQFQKARLGNRVRLVVFNVPLAELLKRNSERPEDDRVSEEYLRGCFDAFNNPEAWWRKYPDAIELRA